MNTVLFYFGGILRHMSTVTRAVFLSVIAGLFTPPFNYLKLSPHTTPPSSTNHPRTPAACTAVEIREAAAGKPIASVFSDPSVNNRRTGTKSVPRRNSGGACSRGLFRKQQRSRRRHRSAGGEAGRRLPVATPPPTGCARHCSRPARRHRNRRRCCCFRSPGFPTCLTGRAHKHVPIPRGRSRWPRRRHRVVYSRARHNVWNQSRWARSLHKDFPPWIERSSLGLPIFKATLVNTPVASSSSSGGQSVGFIVVTLIGSNTNRS